VKGSKVIYSPLLSSFFQKNYPDIKLETDVGVELLIRDLAHSGSFATTHQLIDELQPLVDFTPRQAKDICAAYLENGQVSRIIGDPDVDTFLKRVLDSHGGDIDADTMTELRRRLKRADEINAEST
jgi:hypothetical protein